MSTHWPISTTFLSRSVSATKRRRNNNLRRVMSLCPPPSTKAHWKRYKETPEPTAKLTNRLPRVILLSANSLILEVYAPPCCYALVSPLNTQHHTSNVSPQAANPPLLHSYVPPPLTASRSLFWPPHPTSVKTKSFFFYTSYLFCLLPLKHFRQQSLLNCPSRTVLKLIPRPSPRQLLIKP